MTFSFPIVLWALFALLIPIVIHLFHFRRHKKILFSNVSVLKHIVNQKSSTNRLRELLILASRLLALAAIILAFAYPLLLGKNQTNYNKNQINLFLDNSYSMQSQHEGVRLFDIGKLKAKEIINTYSDVDEFQLIIANQNIRPLQWMNKSDALDAIQATDISSTSHNLEEASQFINRINTSEEKIGRHAYLISDFQKNTELPTSIDSALALSLIPVRASQEKNISIDSAWFENPVPIANRPNQLIIKYTNHSKTDNAETRSSLNINKRVQPLGAIRMEAHSSKVDTVFIDFEYPGWQHISVSLMDHPLTFDNTYYLTFEVLEELKILVIQNYSKNNLKSFDYKNAFSTIPYVHMVLAENNNLNYSDINSYHLIILDELNSLSSGLTETLLKSLENGTNVYAVPNSNINNSNYNSFLARANSGQYSGSINKTQMTISQINKRSVIFKDVYKNSKKILKYPATQGHYDIIGNKFESEKLLQYQNGLPFLVANKFGNGNLFIQSSPNDENWSTLRRHAEIWIPMIYNMALSQNNFEAYALIIGRPNTIQISNPGQSDESVVNIIGENITFIPQQDRISNRIKIRIEDQVSSDGFYKVEMADENLRDLAFNYDRKEAINDYYQDDELLEVMPEAQIIDGTDNIQLASLIKSSQFGTPLWRYFLILALIFLVVESLLIRMK